METLKLNESEQQYYAEVFSACDAENVGKISRAKAYDLFVGADLPPELINQIVDLCGAKRLGYFGRSQFYIALKLIAAAQSRLPLTADSFNSGFDIPLPNFQKTTDLDKRRSQQNSMYASILNSSSLDHDLIQLQERNSNQIASQMPLPPPPAKVRANSLQRPTSLFTEMRQASDDSGESSPSEVPTPVQMAPSVVAPTATNNVNSQSQMWDQCDEDRQLLGTEEESSDRHSSDEEIDIWTISDEQREYYTNQFKLMQLDLTGFLSGPVAKDFFEKSKLPVKELSLIWQLSDVNKDGALSLEEFYTAMHLVVLRRNNIELPSVLPPSLVPKIDGHGAPGQRVAPPDSPNASPVEPNKEDPKIFHPVAVRASPDSQVLLDERELTESSSYEALNEQLKSPMKRLSTSESLELKSGVLAQSAIQRPIPKKPTRAIPPPPPVQQTGAGDTESNIPFTSSAFSTSTSTSLPQGPKKEPPPPPPPRPKKNHSRSASLDLNRLGAPPAVPPRVSPSTAGAFEVYKRPESSRAPSSTVKSPEMAVNNEVNSADKPHDELANEKRSAKQLPSSYNVKTSLRSTIRQQREENMMLFRLNGELNQELLEVMEERIALEIQLEHLKPFPA
uniref:RalBP1-associated Eps domain-containing protein 1 n=1 Tax=Strigamia maritima TaxID=126957 RepID=T1J1T0_STRMM